MSKKCIYDAKIGCEVPKHLCEECAIDAGYTKTICKGCGENKELRAGYCRDCLGLIVEQIDAHRKASEYANSLVKK